MFRVLFIFHSSFLISTDADFDLNFCFKFRLNSPCFFFYAFFKSLVTRYGMETNLINRQSFLIKTKEKVLKI